MGRAAILRDIVGAGLSAAYALLLLFAPNGTAAVPCVAAAVTGALVAWVAWQDLADFTIPDGAVLGIALVGLSERLMAGAGLLLPATETLLLAAADGLIVGGLLWAVRELWYRRLGYDGLGFGDVKLGAAAAVLVGAHGFAVGLLVASLAGIIWAYAPWRADPHRPGTRIAFGALLAPAVWLVFLAEGLPIFADIVGGRPL